jgi:cytochrome c-type biogenesis protein CcmH/NrfG
MVMASALKYTVVGLLFTALLCGCATSARKQLTSTIQRQQKAEQAYASGDLAQALVAYQALTRDVPGHADFWFRLGNVQVRMKRPDQAVDAYQHVLRIQPDHAKAWHNMGIIRLRQAEAAFGQSARYAAGVDPPLQQRSAQMAHGLASLGDAPSGASALPGKDGGATNPERQP